MNQQVVRGYLTLEGEMVEKERVTEKREREERERERERERELFLLCCTPPTNFVYGSSAAAASAVQYLRVLSLPPFPDILFQKHTCSILRQSYNQPCKWFLHAGIG